jgi:hypothetical protein
MGYTVVLSMLIMNAPSAGKVALSSAIPESKGSALLPPSAPGTYSWSRRPRQRGDEIYPRAHRLIGLEEPGRDSAVQPGHRQR